MVELQARNINVSLGRTLVLDHLNLDIISHKVTAIIGPNGSGKSTLLKTLAGLVKPNSGEILIDNHPTTSYSRKQLARKISFLMQNPMAPEDMTVKELVSLGRYSHQSWTGLKAKDDAKIDWAIKQVDLENQIHEPLANLSGGQRQRAWIALALAQDSDCILLDEPTTFLDIRHQLETLCILRQLNVYAAKTIVMVLHDIQQVIKFADYLAIIDQGKIVYYDKINAALDTKIFEQVFGVKVKMLLNEDHEIGCVHVVPRYEGSPWKSLVLRDDRQCELIENAEII